MKIIAIYTGAYSASIWGTMVFANSQIPIYDPETERAEYKPIDANTIIIDNSIAAGDREEVFRSSLGREPFGYHPRRRPCRWRLYRRGRDAVPTPMRHLLHPQPQPEAPRLRVVIPLSREVTPDEYAALSRLVADEIGMDYFDDSTYEPERLMYWPSTPSDGEYVFKAIAGETLDPDAYLAKLSDWRDCSLWPIILRRSINIICNDNVK